MPSRKAPRLSKLWIVFVLILFGAGLWMFTVNAPKRVECPSEWTVRIYQPPRPEPLPQLESGAIDESDEWEEPEITPA
jgi:hypothetical protein